MGALLKQTDLEQVGQQLQLRRSEYLKRHAEELAGLEAEQAEIEALDRLLDAFAQKFETSPLPSPVLSSNTSPNVAPVANSSAISSNNSGDKPSPKTRPPDQREQREQPRTNFDTFSRAVAKAERGW